MIRVGVLALLVVLADLLGATLVSPQGAEIVTDVHIRAVVEAITDEIYANGYHTAYIDVGADRVPLYVNPRIENKMAWVIYKLMPHGEILRGASVIPDKQLAILHRDPKAGFPATDGAALKTIYLDDDDVIRMKTTWRKVYMSIELKPAQKQLEESRRRQELRYGPR